MLYQLSQFNHIDHNQIQPIHNHFNLPQSTFHQFNRLLLNSHLSQSSNHSMVNQLSPPELTEARAERDQLLNLPRSNQLLLFLHNSHSARRTGHLEPSLHCPTRSQSASLRSNLMAVRISSTSRSTRVNSQRISSKNSVRSSTFQREPSTDCSTKSTIKLMHEIVLEDSF